MCAATGEDDTTQTRAPGKRGTISNVPDALLIRVRALGPARAAPRRRARHMGLSISTRSRRAPPPARPSPADARQHALTLPRQPGPR